MNSAMMASGGPPAWIVQSLGFVVVIFVVAKFVVPALKKILGARTQGIEETFRKIETDTRETAARLAEVKQKLAQVNEESQRRIKAAMDDAERTRAQALADAQAQVQAAMEKAKREIQIERDKAVLDLRQQATELTLQAAEHLVQSSMNDPIQDKLVATYLDRLDTVKKS